MNEATLWNQLENRWLDFKKARKIVYSYHLEYHEDWAALIEGKLTSLPPLPENIPFNPDKIYKYLGWKSWKDWLVHPEHRKQYTPFFNAREFVRCLRLKRKSEWSEYINAENPVHLSYHLLLPDRPHLEYRERGWEGWTDWLGTAILFKDYITTKKFIAHMGMKTRNDWNKYCNAGFGKLRRKTKNIYAYPEIAYKKKAWVSWDDWFGISLFNRELKKPLFAIPEGEKPCRCKGLDPDCTVCDGKGYY